MPRLALVLSLLVACGGSGDDASTSSELDRLPSATFPFPLANDTHTVRDDGGVFVGQSLYYQNRNTVVFERPGLPIAVIALPDRLAVAFAAGDHPGFDLAYAGADLPWAREPLSDLPRARFGAIDGIAANDGTAYIALRDRESDDITLYHWRAGQPLESETVPRPFGHRHAQWRDRCPDLTLGMSAAGDLDLLFLQADPTYRLLRARKAAATGAWTVDEIASANPTPPPGVFYELGCKSKLVYDEDDLPMVMTTSRQIPVGTPDVIGGERDPQEPLPVGTLAPPPPVEFIGFYVGGDGRWRHASPPDIIDPTRSHGPSAVLPAQSGGTMASFDLETAPGGIVVGGPYVEYIEPMAESGARLSLPVASIAEMVPAKFAFSSPEPTSTIEGEFATTAYSELDKITFDPCGAMGAYGLDRADLPLSISLLGYGPLSCPGPHVPVRGPSGPGRVTTWAHGRRPYDAMMCFADKDNTTLSVCAGAYSDASELAPDGSLPEPVSVDATGEVEATRATVTVTMSRDFAAGEHADIYVASLAYQGGTQMLVDGPAPATVTLPMPVLVPGTPYRVVVIPHGDHGTAPDFGHHRPVFDFRVAGGAPDPRHVPPPATCDGTYETDGTCLLGAHPDPAANGGIESWLAIDAAFPTVPQLVGPDGMVVPTLDLSWTVALQPGARYVFSYPPDTVAPDGAPYAAADLRHAFVTAVTP